MTKREKYKQRLEGAIAEILGQSLITGVVEDLADLILDIVTDPPPKKRGQKGAGTANSRIVGLYCDLWRARYQAKASPPVTGQAARQLASLVKDFGEKRVEYLLEAYFQMPDGFLIKNRHPVNFLVSKLTEVASFADSGRFVSVSESRNIEKGASIGSVMERIDRGEL